jgi:hypothetical protein
MTDPTIPAWTKAERLDLAGLLLLATGRPAGLASATGRATNRIEAAL